MKNWILMIMFALFSMFATACLSGEDSTTNDPTIEEPADPNVSTAESDITATQACVARCVTEYNECLGDGLSSECECNNARIVCRRGCGYPGRTQVCW